MILKHYLTEAEEIIMRIIWDMDHDPVMSEVYEALCESGQKAWQSTTVSTYLKRLVQKGFLQMNHVSRDYIYAVLISRETYMEAYLARFIAQWGDPARQAIADAAREREA